MRRVFAVAAVALMAVLSVAVPVDAAEVNARETSGGARNGGVYAAVMSPGHTGAPGSYPQCNWQDVWARSLWQRIIDNLTAIAMQVLGRPPANFEEAELVLDASDLDSNLFADGKLAELLNRDPSTIVSYEGSEVTFVHQLILHFIGADTVGRFLSMPTASDDLRGDPLHPQIQRGTYRTPSGAEEPLWWDPYYVTVDDPGPDGPIDCPPGVFYAPRNSDPVALVPDLQDYMADNLPELIADLTPLDRFDDWAYVNVPLNFTAPPSSFAPVQATAYVQDVVNGGSVWAQATATPTSVVFFPGDGSPPVVCDLADAELPFDPSTPGFCSHTYLHSSNTERDGVYQAALAVQWIGEFDSSSSGGTVQFPVPPSWATFELSVAEARAAVSYED